MAFREAPPIQPPTVYQIECDECECLSFVQWEGQDCPVCESIKKRIWKGKKNAKHR